MMLNVAKKDAATLTLLQELGMEALLSKSYLDNPYKFPEHQEMEYRSIMSWTTPSSLG